MTAPMNPDCEAGKHTACAGDAWDFDTDQPVRCACTCHGPDELALTRHVLTSPTADPSGIDADTARDELAWLAGAS